MPRGTTAGCMSIDVRSWHREGLLRIGQPFAHALTWGGEPTEGMGVLTRADAVVLVFRSRRWGGEYGPFTTQRVPIAWTPCAFGGRRPWFRCEVYSRGRYCGRRVALLHSAGGPFACRHCLGLAYASQQEPVRERGIATARKIQMRLGGGESVTGAFPEKPKGMHWRRYNRLRRRHTQAFERSLMGLAKSTERLERWLFR
jgi:hypothetical protein